MKPRPRLVDHRLIATEWAQPLCLLLVLYGLAEIFGIAVIHACHMVVARAIGAEGKCLLSGSHGIIVPTLEQARISHGAVPLVAVGINRKDTRRAFECRLIGIRRILYPTKASLVYEGEPQHTKGRSKVRVYRHRSFEL